MTFEYTFRGADMPDLAPRVQDLLENRDQELELYLRDLMGKLTPSGSLSAFAGSTAPTGWLICDGSVVSQITYSDLFAVLGTTYNTGGEGAGNFRLPNIKGRAIVGRDASQTEFNVLGETGGVKTHTLSTNEMPSHNHSNGIDSGSTTTSGSHSHTGNSTNQKGNHVHQINTGAALALGAANSLFANSGNPPVIDAGDTVGAGDHDHTVTVGTGSSSHFHPINVNSQGGGQAHNNLQPYIALNWIIKT